ncbi:unnamed protein product [Heligmosomoides polygyrus]|uniref:PDZ domain-containing protein n=1 Tax=Heligmosomoides polygyrus TaxID=6339 RepID=A0A183GFG9_HELPZ|nr:unnamed protein product [Heligmosomoides polygyrus]
MICTHIDPIAPPDRYGSVSLGVARGERWYDKGLTLCLYFNHRATRWTEKSSQSEEFGFNLHAEKGRGHFIGTVDQGGIGDRAGLRMGQRIVGVNGVLVYPNTPHKEVVAQIKRSPLRTTLLVASEEVDKWYKEHGAEFSFDYVEEDPSSHQNHHQQISPHVSSS